MVTPTSLQAGEAVPLVLNDPALCCRHKSSCCGFAGTKDGLPTIAEVSPLRDARFWWVSEVWEVGADGSRQCQGETEAQRSKGSCDLRAIVSE